MRILEEDISNIDQFVEGHQPMNITSMCTVFAESEIVSLLAKGADKGDIALGITIRSADAPPSLHRS